MKLILLSDCVDKAGKGIIINGLLFECKVYATEENCATPSLSSTPRQIRWLARVRTLCRKSCGLCCKFNNLNH